MRARLCPTVLLLLLGGWYAISTATSIDPQQIVTLLPQDAIPAILDPAPLLVSAQEAEAEMEEDEAVIGVSWAGESHAYPITFLSWHEIVNDVVGGKAIAVTW
ncbi:MAG: DUF3179 domain-containing protein [Nitrospinota bacterium]|nr:MAG: DUF3179 domain-containing protein [Nitrospinota bacterium]